MDKRPNLLHIMQEHEHVAEAVMTGAYHNSCMWLIKHTFCGEEVVMGLKECPGHSPDAAFHYSKEELALAARQYSDCYRAEREKLH